MAQKQPTRTGPFRCTYCRAEVPHLPVVCECGANLTKPMMEMGAAEMFLAGRLNGYVAVQKWMPLKECDLGARCPVCAIERRMMEEG